jgi:LacI family transcriptional regulator
MPTTIRDVAHHLKLSITTVSRALDGYHDVAPATRALVIRTAEELGYTPNRAARQLRRQRTDTIGYILPADRPQFADPYFSEFIAGLGDAASANDNDLLVSAAPADSAEEQALYQRWVQGGKVDGIVVNRTRLQDWRIRYLADRGKPFVSLERSLEPVEFVGIETDSAAGIAELVAYLTGLGHSRIGYIGASRNLKIEQDRREAYRRALASAGIRPDPALEAIGDLTAEGGYRRALELLALPQPPTAIGCINDLTAIGAMHAAHELGLVVGRDVAVAGFDGIADAAHTEPPLTTLDQPVYSIAGQLVRLLLALIGGETLTERQVKIRPKLLVRASTSGFDGAAQAARLRVESQHAALRKSRRSSHASS